MREVQNGRVRWSPDDPGLAGLIADKGASRFQEHGGFYYLVSPFDPEPWRVFGPSLPPSVASLPPGFASIFGSVVPDWPDDATWLQELGLWRDAKRPDWVNDAMEINAQAQFEHYCLGLAGEAQQWRLLSYRLTNGAEWVYCPDAVRVKPLQGYTEQSVSWNRVPNGLLLAARMVYEYPLYGVATYQSGLIQAGIDIPDNRRVYMLKFPGAAQHQG